MMPPPETGKGAPGQAPLTTPNRHQRSEVKNHGSRTPQITKQTALRLDLPKPQRSVVPVEPTWWVNANARIDELAKADVEFDAMDVAETVGEPAHSRHWGRLFSAARRRGVIAPTGAAPSRRRTAHKSLAYRWRGTPEVRQEAS